MKLGDVLKNERERRKLTSEEVAKQLGITLDQYQQMEAGNSPAEEWGPKLANIAIRLETPTARLISPTGKFANIKAERGGCGKLVMAHREKRGLSQEELAGQLEIPVSELASIESCQSPIEEQGPILLRFAEIVELPIFNLFFPRGLPLDRLTDYR
jgi:transcriptional regulator with XRE-family HTH domain